ncbi:MAG: non-canonical purine NTP pyrophosphatase, partial [Flavobacteriales bacterium]
DPAANMRLLLRRLRPASDRRARFRTVIAYVDGSRERLFEGVVDGVIADAPRGEGGFGYDPVFVPAGEARTFAEMTLGEKNAMSHRARAFGQALAFLRGLQP